MWRQECEATWWEGRRVKRLDGVTWVIIRSGLVKRCGGRIFCMRGIKLVRAVFDISAW